MKKIFLFLLTTIISFSSFAQNLPQGIAYQAVAVKEGPYSVAGENPQTIYWSNKDIKVRFTILDQYPNSTNIFQEFHSVTTDDYGVFNLIVGQGSVLLGDFETIPWELGTAHLQVEIDFDNDDNYTVTSFERFWSVPYAKHSQSTKEIDPIFNASLANSISPSDTAYWNNKLDSYTETDPVFNASVAKGISSTDTAYWNNKLDSYTETDPVFNASVAKGISSTDTAYWNNKLDSYTETDPVFNASVAKGISSTDTAYWNNKLDSYTETDPAFNASVAKGISSSDTASWNNKLDSYTETDPAFNASVAKGISSSDTAYWNNKLDSYTETDPAFNASVAKGISSSDTAYWNNKLDSYTETDPAFNASVAKGISSSDTAYWNQSARNTLDIDSTNEIQNLTLSNDTLMLSKTNDKIYLGGMSYNSNIPFLMPSDLKDSLPKKGTIYFDVANATLNFVGDGYKEIVDTTLWNGLTSTNSGSTRVDSVVVSFKPRYKNFNVFPVYRYSTSGVQGDRVILIGGKYSFYTDSDSIVNNGILRTVFKNKNVSSSTIYYRSISFIELDSSELWCHLVLPITSIVNFYRSTSINSKNMYSSFKVSPRSPRLKLHFTIPNGKKRYSISN